MKSFVPLLLNMSWFDITTRIEPNDLTLFLRDAKNFIIGWDFDENLAIDGNVDETDDNFNLKRVMVGFWERKFPFEEYYND